MTPQQIGRYQIIAKIGQGAMGEVYRAHDPVLNRDVAVKTIAAGRGEDETLRKRFQREAQSAANLSHPNIVTVFELGEHADQLFMAMELLEGSDLKQAIQHGDLSLPQKLEVLEKICEGLAFAHSKNIVHRDLKPANIHLGKDGSVKVMDFGLARFGGSDMTRTGMVMGTPHYMSPEQVKGAKATTRSDVFSLGALAYEVLTSRKPFEAETMHAVLFKVMQEEPPPARELLPALPPVLIQVVEKALAKEPADRFSDAGQLLAALRKARQAIAAGRGDRLLPELKRGARPQAAEARPRPAGASEHSASGSRSGPSMSRSHSGGSGRLPWIVAGVAVVAILGFAFVAWRVGMARAPSAAPSGSAEVQTLARTLAQTQVELARRKLDDRDFEEAAHQAQRALELDPKNAAAEEVLRQAREVLDKVDAAAADAQTAQKTGDAARQAAAAWTLMQLDASHAALTELAPRLGATFRGRAEEARRMMEDARKAATDALASRLPTFEDGTSLAQQGENAFRAGKFGLAAQRFLQARDHYQRAQRLVH
jgi:tRNA A-37 threonylcarbamoyl transferase component Bud32/tetratricopeptide (TPR) repeat protein